MWSPSSQRPKTIPRIPAVLFSVTCKTKKRSKNFSARWPRKVGDRPGGYVRVIKLGFRRGDGAETALIELVDFNEVYNPNAGKVKTTKKTRRGGSAKKPAETAAGDLAVAETVETEVNDFAGEIEATAQVETPAEEITEAAEEAVADAPAEEEAAPEDSEGEEKKDA
jgi:large subunit ribosomal protein L17